MSAPAVEARDLSKFFGARAALDGVNFSLPAGRILGLLGPNGAGKSTLLNLLSGLLAPSEGRVLLFGEELGSGDALRRRLGFLGHHSFLYADFTAEENLRFYATLYGLNEADGARRADYWLDCFGLKAARRYRVRAFSQGMRQRLALSRALLHDPDLLLLDEPFAGLDEASCAQVVQLLAGLRAQGKTVIASTHQKAQLEPLAPDLLLLEAGRICGS